MPLLADVAEINPRLSLSLADEDPVSFLGMADVSELGGTSFGETRPYSQVKKGYTPFQDGDLLVAKITPCFENGKIAQTTLGCPLGFGSTEFHVVRVDQTKVDPRFVLHMLRTPRVRKAGEKRMTGSAGQKRVPKAFIEGLALPSLSLPEQHRIASILDQADELRAQRRRALTLLDDLADSIFTDMFGRTNAWESVGLFEVVDARSGGTPSKQDARFWGDGTPWFSPKDMKSPDLWDATDHITEEAIRGTSLTVFPANTVAVVVRGMILAHTFPVSCLRVASTINQDMKALVPKTALDPQFLAYAIRSQSNDILGLVSTAGHGTKRLDSEGLGSVRIPEVPYAVQAGFGQRVVRLQCAQDAHLAHLAHVDELFASLQQRAFAGEL